MHESTPTLSALRARLAKYAPDCVADHGETSPGVIPLGHAPLDTYLDGGLRRGQLHEIFAQEAEDSGAATGFAAMLGILAQNGEKCGERGKGKGAKSLLWLRSEEAERRGGRFHAAGFVELGGDPGALVHVTVPDTLALLRSAGDAVRSSGLGAVIVECWGNPHQLDLMASRRLTLAAEQSRVTTLMLRPGGKPAPSTADTRWSLSSAPSRPLEANAPGAPVFDLTLLRRRAGPAGKSWRLEWDRDGHHFQEPSLSGAALPLSVGGSAADMQRRAQSG